MGSEYLTEAAIFECPFGMKFKANENANHKVKHNGRKLLTKAAILSPAMPPVFLCPELTKKAGGQTPIPCSCIVGSLQGAIKHRATTNLLTMDSKAVCAAGKNITPKNATSSVTTIDRATYSGTIVPFPTIA